MQCSCRLNRTLKYGVVECKKNTKHKVFDVLYSNDTLKVKF